MNKFLSFAVVLLFAFPAFSQTTLGTSTSATNPQRSGDATTGLLSPAVDAVSISSGGTEMMRVNGTGVGIGTTSPGALFTVGNNNFEVNSAGSITTAGAIYASASIYMAGGSNYIGSAGTMTANGTATSGSSTYGILSTSGPIVSWWGQGYTGFSDGGSTQTVQISDSSSVSYLDGGGNFGIGTKTPANLLDIGTAGGIHITSGIPSSTSSALYNNSGALTWNGSALAMASSVAGTTNYIPRFTSASALGNSVIYQSGSDIGIGTTSPAFTLDVSGQSHILSGSSPVLEVEGTTANTTGTVQIIEALAHSSGTMASSFGPVIGFWIEDTGTLDSIAAIGAVKDGASNTGDLVFYTTLASTSTEKMRILNSGYVGIGTTAPAQELEVAGQVQIDGWATASSTAVCRNNNVLSTCSSSIRYKENVKNFDRGLEDLMRMRPVRFKWKGRDEDDFGLVAEEMHDIDPLYVTYQGGRIEGVKYPQLTAVIVNAVKEQQQEISDLKQEIADLKALISKPDVDRSKGY